VWKNSELSAAAVFFVLSSFVVAAVARLIIMALHNTARVIVMSNFVVVNLTIFDVKVNRHKEIPCLFKTRRRDF